jgi:hypothetical protein
MSPCTALHRRSFHGGLTETGDVHCGNLWIQLPVADSNEYGQVVMLVAP